MDSFSEKENSSLLNLDFFNSYDELDVSSSQNYNNLFLNKKIKSTEFTYDLGKTKDTKNNTIVICKEIVYEIKGRKIDEGTQTRSIYDE